MKRLSSLILIFIGFTLLGKVAVTSFCPEVLTVIVTAVDPAEETVEEDETGEDDKVVGHKPGHLSLGADSLAAGSESVFPLLSACYDIVAQPPQG
jgi:hypothetical protein